MALQFNGASINDVKFNNASIDKLQLNGTTYWQRNTGPVIPIGDNNVTTSSVSASTKGSVNYNGGGAGNDGATSATRSETFLDRFSSSPTAFSKSDSYPIPNSYISANASLVTSGSSRGQASVYFTLSTSAPVGTHTMRYRMRVTASNAAGTSSVHAYWQVTVTFTVAQGQVPTLTRADVSTLRPSSGSFQGEFGSLPSNWHDYYAFNITSYFNNGDAPITSYSKANSNSSGSSYLSFTHSLSSDGSCWQKHTLSQSASAGNHTMSSSIGVRARNKYGQSAIFYWHHNTSWDVNAPVPQTPKANSSTYNITLNSEIIDADSFNSAITKTFASGLNLAALFDTRHGGAMSFAVDGRGDHAGDDFPIVDFPIISGNTIQIKDVIQPLNVGIYTYSKYIRIKATNSVGTSSYSDMLTINLYWTLTVQFSENPN